MINFQKKIKELFPKLEHINFDFHQAKIRDRHRLEPVNFNSLKDLKAKVKFTLYVKPAQDIINVSTVKYICFNDMMWPDVVGHNY